MPDDDIRILKLNVVDSRIDWSVWESDVAGVRERQVLKGREDLALGGLERRTIELLIELLRGVIDRTDRTELEYDLFGELLPVLGEHLYQLLFTGAVRSKLEEGMWGLQDGSLKLFRVELEFEGSNEAWLTSLPWEYLHTLREPKSVGGGQFLATTATKLVLNRKLSLSRESRRELPTRQPVKVLLVSASPRGLPPVDCTAVRDELRAMDPREIELNDDLVEAPSFEPQDVNYEPMVTRPQFRRLVGEFKPHIVHFIGHGQRKRRGGQVAFVKEDGTPDWVDDKDFANWISDTASLKLVFLQACESALPDPYGGISTVAQYVSLNDIPAVVAMQYKVEQQIANTFARHFYQALAGGDPVDLAVKEGREAVTNLPDAAQHLSFGLPVIYLRSYESMIIQQEPLRLAGPPDAAPKGLPVGNAVATGARAEDLSPCPSCNTPRQLITQKACLECGLRYICRSCGELYLVPQANFCQCGEQIPAKQRQRKANDRRAFAVISGATDDE